MESFLIKKHQEDRSMRCKRFKTEQIIKILKESELGLDNQVLKDLLEKNA